MTGPLKCSYGCGYSFYTGEEQRQHEQTCRQRGARQAQRPAGASGARASGAGERSAG